MTAAPAKKRSRTALAVVIALAVLGSCIPCTGIVAAVAIPGFIGYVRRSKTVEARRNVEELARLVMVFHESARAEGIESVRGLPPPCPRTPATAVGPTRQLWPADADPAWAELGFAPPDPLYYAYEYQPDPDGLGFAVRAYGDLDGDGVESVFERRGRVDPTTREIALDPLEVTNELE